MARVVVLALGVIAAILGYLMDNVWLLSIGAAVLALALLSLLVLAARRRRRRAAAEQRAVPLSREDELRALGISGIRPKGSPQGDLPRATAAEETGFEGLEVEADGVPPVAEVSGGAAATPEDGPLPERHPEPPHPEPRRPEPRRADPRRAEAERAEAERAAPEDEAAPAAARVLDAPDDSRFWRAHSPTAVTSLLRALWAATDVQTVALFSADGSGTTLEAALSHHPAARRDGRFLAGNAFLDAVSAERSLTVLDASDPLLRLMPHYKRPVPLGGAAVLPVRTLDDGPVFLVVDLGPDQAGFSERQRGLLTQYAGLLGAMLEEPDEAAAPSAVPTRREIIAAEMERARAVDRPLALALVYQSDAERVSAQGAGAVADAERRLRRELEDVSPDGRVERFGELMIGVFLRDAPDGVEAWAARVRARADAEGLPLVTGIARLTARHRDADALRADAANALQEALAAQEHYVIA